MVEGNEVLLVLQNLLMWLQLLNFLIEDEDFTHLLIDFHAFVNASSHVDCSAWVIVMRVEELSIKLALLVLEEPTPAEVSVFHFVLVCLFLLLNQVKQHCWKMAEVDNSLEWCIFEFQHSLLGHVHQNVLLHSNFEKLIVLPLHDAEVVLALLNCLLVVFICGSHTQQPHYQLLPIWVNKGKSTLASTLIAHYLEVMLG